MSSDSVGSKGKGKVTDGLAGIREKSGWVSDGKSPKTEDRLMSSSRGQGEASRIPADEGRMHPCRAPERGEWS